MAFCFFWNIKSLYLTYFHSYPFILSLTVINCHFLLFVVICWHSLSLVVIRCHFLYRSLLLVVTQCTTRCHSLLFVVPLVVTRCYSLYHSLSFIFTRCHSLSLDVPIVCRFINDRLQMLFKIDALKNFAIFRIKRKL